MIVNKKVRVAMFAGFITFIQISGYANGGERNKPYNYDKSQSQLELCYVSVRATKYHKTETGSDFHTRKEESSTGVKLREGSSKVIGTVAMDPKIAPVGSLILLTTKDGNTLPYLCVDTGSDVIKRKASKELARREGRGKEWATRPVIDIYSPRAVTNDWTTILIIKDPLAMGLKASERLRRLQERMSVGYWMSRGYDTLGQRTQLLAYNN